MDEILPAFDFVEKFKAFGFDAIKVAGDDYEGLFDALSYDAAKAGEEAKPRAIILDSTKGCGVKEVEDTEFNHSMTVDQETFDKWIADVQSQLDALQAA